MHWGYICKIWDIWIQVIFWDRKKWRDAATQSRWDADAQNTPQLLKIRRGHHRIWHGIQKQFVTSSLGHWKAFMAQPKRDLFSGDPWAEWKCLGKKLVSFPLSTVEAECVLFGDNIGYGLDHKAAWRVHWVSSHLSSCWMPRIPLPWKLFSMGMAA